MLRHTDIWHAIDRLAQEHNLSPSGLARKAGLDPTTFNKSKRVTKEGKLRWPSTESVAKILTATGASLGEFISYVGTAPGVNGNVYNNIPLIGLAQAGGGGFFDDGGYPAGSGWDEIPFPGIGDPNVYAVEITGDSMEPAYRDGDIVIVSPNSDYRRGDRVVVKTVDGQVMAKSLRRETGRNIELQSINEDHEDIVLDKEQVEWMARIVWVSQ